MFEPLNFATENQFNYASGFNKRIIRFYKKYENADSDKHKLVPKMRNRQRERAKKALLKEAKKRASRFAKLPQPTEVLGSGCFGTAFATDNPNWIVKLTSDPGEPRRLIQLLSKGKEDLVCDVLAIVWIPGDNFLIWKERCKLPTYEVPGEWDVQQALRREIGAYVHNNDAHSGNCGYDRYGNMVAFDL